MESTNHFSRYASFYRRTLGIVVLILVCLWLDAPQRASRRENRLIASIFNYYHLVTNIYLDYNNNTFRFYGESLEAAKEYLELSPMGSGARYTTCTANCGHCVTLREDIFARVRFYIEDELLFSITVTSMPPEATILEATIIETTNPSHVFAVLRIDNTLTRGSLVQNRLSIIDLIAISE